MSQYRDIAQLANQNVDVRTVDYFYGPNAFALSQQSLEPADLDFLGLSQRLAVHKSGNRVVHIGGGHTLTLVGPADAAIETNEFLV